MPRLVEAIQWHRYRANDPARIWLYEQLRAVVASWPAAVQPESAPDTMQGAEPSATDGAAR